MAEANNQEVKSKRELLRERMLKRNPELNVDDPEAYSGGISDYLDELDGQLSGYKDREEKFTNMFNSDPRSAHFITNWHQGSDPAVELVRQFGTGIKDAIDDPERQEEIAAANKEYVERVAKSKELEEEFDKNLDTTLETVDAFQQENGLSDDEVDQVMAFLENIMLDGIVGKYSRESMEMGLKAIRHDEDVEVAAQDAEVKGRNAKIDEKLRKRSAGDGTAALAGKNGRGSAPAGPDLGALRNAGTNDIFARGGERRTRRNQ